MSLRRSKRSNVGKPPVRYTPEWSNQKEGNPRTKVDSKSINASTANQNNGAVDETNTIVDSSKVKSTNVVEHQNEPDAHTIEVRDDHMGSSNQVELGNQTMTDCQNNKTSLSCQKTEMYSITSKQSKGSSVRHQLELKIKQLEETARLEREMEVRENLRQKEELEGQKRLRDLERQNERREFERQKLLLEARVALEAASNSGASSRESVKSEATCDKVQRWLFSDKSDEPICFDGMTQQAIIGGLSQNDQASNVRDNSKDQFYINFPNIPNNPIKESIGDIPTQNKKDNQIDNSACANNGATSLVNEFNIISRKECLNNSKKIEIDNVAEAVSSAMKSLANSLKTMGDSAGIKVDLPRFGGRPDDWPAFINAYNRTNRCRNYSEDENLVRLQRSLLGDAYDAVRPLFVSASNVNAIIRTLERLYGRPEFIIESLLAKIKQIQVVKDDDPTGLIKFSTAVLNFTTIATSLNMDAYLTNPVLLSQLIRKLPPNFKYNWAKYITVEKVAIPTLKQFSDWLNTEATIMSVYHRPLTSSSRATGQINTVLEPISLESCVFCKSKHKNAQCDQFRRKEIDQRWKMVTENKLCFSCLSQHRIQHCETKKACGIKGCRKYHHRLLHKDSVSVTPYSNTSNARTISSYSNNSNRTILNRAPTNLSNINTTIQSSKDDEQPTQAVNTVNGSNRVLLKVCPVVLYGPYKQVSTFALLDDGSTTTLIDSQLAAELNLEGVEAPLTVCWANSVMHTEEHSCKVSVQIKGVNESETFTLNDVRTTSRLDLPCQSIDSVRIKQSWPHLEFIGQSIPTYYGKPRILIGQNYSHLILTRKAIEGPPNSPILSWTKLGWTLHGHTKQISGRLDSDYTLTCYEKEKDNLLHDLIKLTIDTENYGTKISDTDSAAESSYTNDRALKILEKTTKKVGAKYETGLLWKTDEFQYPKSYGTALSRLRGVERKMKKDQQFKDDYNKKINEYLEKGYARKLTKEEISFVSGRTYYLPHFGVNNPNKPGKLRFVFDAASKTNGISFNDGLLSGPDLLNSLPKILLNFRIGKFAIVGDIQEMFHQIRIREEDQQAQRFLWRNGDTDREPDVYAMEVMTFGATCSPATALFVVNKNAQKFKETYPEASKSIIEKEYMDDLLDTFDDLETGIKRIQEIISIHAEGGFKIVNWLSNSKKIIETLPEELRAKSVKLLNPDSSLPTEKILGMRWNSDIDMFEFRPNLKQEEKNMFERKMFPTKREILRAAMAIFDPLGLITPFTIKGRLLVQDVWRAKTDWDEPVTGEISKKWLSWVDELHLLKSVEVPRCYTPSISEANSIDLHIFVDGSQEAAAAAAYLRIDMSSHVVTILVMSRAKVAPLKPITIPRMELQAALMGSRLARTVEEDLELKINRRTFWSDSQTILHWISRDSNNFKQYVAHRTKQIQELTKKEEWRWIPSKVNVADLATRRKPTFSKKVSDLWIQGPGFLKLNEFEWPEQPLILAGESSEENKKLFVGLLQNEIEILPLEKYSSWQRLVRISTWVFRYVRILKYRIVLGADRTKPTKSDNIPSLTSEELKKTEPIIFRLMQERSFKDELKLLLKNKSVPPSSRIYKLSPFLDAEGVMRCKGRLSSSPDLSAEEKHPIILDGKEFTTRLIIRQYHQICFHQGLETVMAELRRRFWMLSMRPAVKKIKTDCALCQLKFKMPQSPEMAPLHISRVTKPPHAFYYTGIDYFGPIQVTVGRRHEKRWGVLFTCLSTRAVHLEVAHSLNTESCIMAIQRFVSRRPCPYEMLSDNGTNFTSAEQEIRSSVKSLDHIQIQKTLSDLNGIKWTFTAPRAPHMGGSWERLIRSVKTALKTVLSGHAPKDEELQTVLVRIENILNCRPLTHMPVEPEDPFPLTPNHFLKEAFCRNLDEDLLPKVRCKRIKNLLDSFWQRWIKEYVPSIIKQQKWHIKREPPKIDDLVIIADDTNPRNTWPLGRIVDLHQGKDGQIRVVDVRTNRGTFRRPMSKIILLRGREC